MATKLMVLLPRAEALVIYCYLNIYTIYKQNIPPPQTRQFDLGNVTFGTWGDAWQGGGQSKSEARGKSREVHAGMSESAETQGCVFVCNVSN